MSDRIYVCEWVKKDFSVIENNEEFAILTNYDYTYHDSLEQAQKISSFNYRGYALAKEIILAYTDFIKEENFHKKIHCECIWVYEDNFSIGRYVMQSNNWIYDAYCEAWHHNWEDMLLIPTK